MTLFLDLCGNYLRLELHLRQVIYRLTEASQWKKRCMKALITCLISFKLKNPLIYFFFDNILEKHFKSISSTLQLEKNPMYGVLQEQPLKKTKQTRSSLIHALYKWSTNCEQSNKERSYTACYLSYMTVIHYIWYQK